MTSPARHGGSFLELCDEADRFLAAGERDKAASLYMSAFRTHAGPTVSHMRKLSHLEVVLSTLENWLDGDCDPEGSNKGLVAVFLSTLCPNNVSATVFKMESLLLNGGHGCEEIFTRCTSILEGKRNAPPEGRTGLVLELTRALACLFSDRHDVTGLKLYLKAYHQNKSDAVQLVKSRQGQHLDKIVKAFKDRVSQTHLSLISKVKLVEENEHLDAELTTLAIEFVLALAPDNLEVRELKAQQLFLIRNFAESIETYSAIINQVHSDDSSGVEKLARLLTSRAAACFSVVGKIQDACNDLGEAFKIHPATARNYFQTFFTEQGTGMAARSHLQQQAERGLSDFKECVLLRLDLRSSEGVELLDPVITNLRALCHLEPGGGGRELRVRLADCLLLRGEHKEALSICSQLASARGQQSYQNTVQVLRGYASFLSDDHKGALEDFQAVIEHNAPHPSSCVRALCGRGLLRMIGGLNYLTALDYMTACRLHPQEAALCFRSLVPWNYRGLLFTVLLEQGRVMLEATGKERGTSCGSEKRQKENEEEASRKDEHRSGIPVTQTYLVLLECLYSAAVEGCELSPSCLCPRTPAGVQCLASLLTELQPGADGPQILSADSLYQLGRVEEAYRLLLSIGSNSPRAPVLARLALLQLRRGFLYDTNQLLKKLIQCGDTSCLRPLLAVAHKKDRSQLQKHCHFVAKRILETLRDESTMREAVAYLSIGIMASGGDASESLLERARCYAFLGQRKTAIYDFSAILKDKPKHVPALCGRGFTYLTLNQQKECTQDLLAALLIYPDEVRKDVLSLKDKARGLVCDWLRDFCRHKLSKTLSCNGVPVSEAELREETVVCGTLLKTEPRDPRWHLLFVDLLLAKGDVKAAGARLVQVFGQEPRDAVAQGRLGVMEAWEQKYCSAALRLSKLTDKHVDVLDSLLQLVPADQRRRTAQAAAGEAGRVSSGGQWDQALSLLTMSVRAAGDHKPQYLRQRAACLAQLGLHRRAVSDLDRVILRHSEAPHTEDELRVQSEDLCRRGRSSVLASDDGPALEDFTKAMGLHRDWAVACIESGLGRSRAAECFLKGALQNYGEQQLDKAWTLVECGLAVDGENTELKRLRTRVKREVAGPCNVN
ncbi:uncharacterized protein ttc34 [Eucyclogobius newberryi]|uniref:uncharacterized protein ttc34 n=1 Tax=Eucyclogobius newberryi TaxID=166745 RepID=UPI003B5AABC8